MSSPTKAATTEELWTSLEENKEEAERLMADQQAINDLSCPNINEAASALTQALRNQEKATDDAYRELVVSAKELYNYEKLSIQADFNALLEEVHDQMVDTVQQELRRCKEIYVNMCNKGKRTAEGSQKFLVDGLFKPKLPLEVEKLRKEKQDRQRKRPHLWCYTNADQGKGADEGSATSFDPTPLSKEEKCGIPALMANALCLTDMDMRRDFAAILEDWSRRAKAFLISKGGNGSGMNVTKVEATASGGLNYGDLFFEVGDRVLVHSQLTKEEFVGTITKVSDGVIHLLLGGDIRTCMYMEHLSSGRLELSRVLTEQEEYETAVNGRL
eukprot:430982_1